MHRLSIEELSALDEYIQRSKECKILNEQEVKMLCEKAKYFLNYSDKYSPNNLT